MAVLGAEVRRVSEILLGRILSGGYPPGLRLPPETQLATELECGRSTIREALRHLADQGLLQSRRGSGALVLDWRREGTPALMPTWVQQGRFEVPPHVLAAEMLRMRTLMACEAVRLAALYAPEGSLAEAREHMRLAPSFEADPAEHAVNELEMYRALVRASGMWPAVWTVNAIWGPMRELNRMFAPAIGPVRPEFQPTIERLLELIEARDVDRAVEHVQAWFRKVDTRLVRAIERIVTVSPDLAAGIAAGNRRAAVRPLTTKGAEP
jgi:DNA-binding FadR family transcriptional regulator